ncbi:MAG TPA: MarR family transcriptional regulator [Streptosporangiaceae bacterium]|jgi:DNA-binding MarR family transcriptional regulator
MPAQADPPDSAVAAAEAPVTEIESALHSLARCLKQARLHDFLLKQAGVDIDQAGLAVLYALRVADTDLRLTDLAERLRIDAPAVTRKAQQLQRLALISRARDADDARAARLQLSARGREVVDQFLVARRQWLTQVLAGWSCADRAEFARLLGQFTSDIRDQLGELEACLFGRLPGNR